MPTWTENFWIHCNHCEASVQYFAILHAPKETYKIENRYPLTLIRKNKCRSLLQKCLCQMIVVVRHLLTVAGQDHSPLRQKL